MRSSWVLSLSWSVLVCSVAAQTQFVGARDVQWPNPTGIGSPVLHARVHYPSVASGINTPVSNQGGGYPVVVFLHGWGLLGNNYHAAGDFLAREGFIAVMMNTAQFSYQGMENDARAMFPAIAAANAEPGGFFEGALRPDRVGLLGHSMGAAVIAYVLHEDPQPTVSNPGYLCGLGIAPVDPAITGTGTVVHVPIGLVSGLNDVLTPPASHAQPFYNALETTQGLKFHYQMGVTADHMNLMGLEPQHPSVYFRSRRIMAGFFGQFLAGNLLGLESVLGPVSVSDPNLDQLDMDAAVPQSWADGEMRIGHTTRISVAAEDGLAGLLAAGSTASPTATFLGELLLDPATTFTVAESVISNGRMDVLLSVPNSPLLIGTTFAAQGAGATILDPFKLGSAISFVIQG